MSQSLRTMGAFALGGVIVAVAALAVRPGPVAGAPTTGSEIALHTLTVQGNGKVTVVPDVARVYLGVTLTKPTVKEARNAAAQVMTDVIAAIKGLGIADKDIQTTGLSLSARYAENSSTKIVGYIISEQVQVTVRDLDKAGDVVDTATAKGATDVNGISFELSDPAKALDDARAAAIASARTSAQAMASAAQVTLGAVVSVADASAPTPIYYGTASVAAPMADVKTPVQPGTQDISAVVTVVFELD
ncbi:MAG: SIMPL domain-containing protein [Chloroflexi bacterium]|nr:SIMPL domain-containing protein [Chloroflexota bacterium]